MIFNMEKMLKNIGYNNVDVFSLDLDVSNDETEKYERFLSPDEVTKANRFCFQKDRRRYIVSRGHLREILNNYLDKEPCDINFEYTEQGKPFLPLRDNKEFINFNVSHSHELAVFAVAKNKSVGIDVEYIRPVSDVEKLAERYFSEQEYKKISSIDHDRKEELFFKYWTAKEAYLKATGQGITALKDIDFDSSSFDNNFLFIDKKDREWMLYKLDIPHKGYVSSLVVGLL